MSPSNRLVDWGPPTHSSVFILGVMMVCVSHNKWKLSVFWKFNQLKREILHPGNWKKNAKEAILFVFCVFYLWDFLRLVLARACSACLLQFLCALRTGCETHFVWINGHAAYQWYVWVMTNRLNLSKETPAHPALTHKQCPKLQLQVHVLVDWPAWYLLDKEKRKNIKGHISQALRSQNEYHVWVDPKQASPDMNELCPYGV